MWRRGNSPRAEALRLETKENSTSHTRLRGLMLLHSGYPHYLRRPYLAELVRPAVMGVLEDVVGSPDVEGWMLGYPAREVVCVIRGRTGTLR